MRSSINTPIPKITTEITSETSSSSKDVQHGHKKEDRSVSSSKMDLEQSLAF
nr:hypothetical protein [Fredinandcohnia onubensis]